MQQNVMARIDEFALQKNRTRPSATLNTSFEDMPSIYPVAIGQEMIVLRKGSKVVRENYQQYKLLFGSRRR